jgi:thiamine-monophosphate kinase
MPSRSSHPSPAQLGEFQLIRDLRRRFGQTGRSVLKGIGDDAAIIHLPARRHLLLTTDLLAEGIHFDTGTATYEDVGYKAAVANLSDIAAMGGTPHYLLVALAVPAARRCSEIQQLYSGLMRACRLHAVELVGGDTSASRQGLFLGITLIGTVRPGRVLTRDGARVGDRLYVTGTLGDSLAGLNLLAAKRGTRPAAFRHSSHAARYLVGRHLHPTPRVAMGQLLTIHRLATAAIDLSDGLSGDLRHVCEQSRVGAEIEASALPLSSACRAYAGACRVDPVRLALAGGEDYELLFTVPPRNCRKLERFAQEAGCRVSRIGTVRSKGFGLRLKHADGTLERLPISSYQHFLGRQPSH